MCSNELSEAFESVCDVGLIGQLAEEYIRSCREYEKENAGESASKKIKK